MNRKIVRVFAMILLFVVMPLTSWYYLKQGAVWRKDALSELITVGKLNPVYAVNGKREQYDLLEKKVSVIHYIEHNPLSESDLKTLSIFEQVYDQFHARPELRLLIITNANNPSVVDALSTKKGAGTEFWVVDTTGSNWRPLLTDAMTAYADKRKLPKMKNFIALSDVHGNIKAVYDADDEKQIKRMVQHIAILLPFK